MADVAEIDLIRAAEEKLRLNAEKYPPKADSGPDATAAAQN